MTDLTIAISSVDGGGWIAKSCGKTMYFDDFADAVAWVENEREKEENERLD